MVDDLGVGFGVSEQTHSRTGITILGEGNGEVFACVLCLVRQ